MMKLFSKKMKFLFVSVFAFILSITFLVIGAPKAYAAAPKTLTMTQEIMVANTDSSGEGELAVDGYGKWEWGHFYQDEGGMYCVYPEPCWIGFSFNPNTDISGVYLNYNGTNKEVQFHGKHVTEAFDRTTLPYTMNDITKIDNAQDEVGVVIFNYGDGEGKYYYTDIELSITLATPKYAVNIAKGTGIKDVYLANNATATSGSASGTKFEDGKVYGFAKLDAGYKVDSSWTLVSGTANKEDAIYCVGSKTINGEAVDFGTINATFKTCSLTPNGNGTGNGSNVTLTYGEAATIPALSRTNYTFKGWNTLADGTGTDYTTELSITDVNAILDANIDVLYAKWILDPAIQAVVDKINTITTPLNKTTIEEARALYDALDSAKKVDVINYQKLVDAEAAYKVIEKINSIGEVKYDEVSKNLIDSARTAYDELTNEQKELVNNYKSLQDAEAKYEELTPSKGGNKGLIIALCIICPIVIIAIVFIILIILKRQKDDDNKDEENKNNKEE